MRAISLWQPWASGMAIGAKRNETRSWPTSYRGDLLICSAKRKPRPEESGEHYEAALKLPYGCALCVVELYDCRPTEDFTTRTIEADTHILITKREASLGDYAPGRFAWRTCNLRCLGEPIPMRGRQGLWIVSPDDEELIMSRITTPTK